MHAYNRETCRSQHFIHFITQELQYTNQYDSAV